MVDDVAILQQIYHLTLPTISFYDSNTEQKIYLDLGLVRYV